MHHILGYETSTKIGIGFSVALAACLLMALAFEVRKIQTSGWRVFFEALGIVCATIVGIVTFLHDDQDTDLSLDITSPAGGDQVAYCTEIRVEGRSRMARRWS